MKFKIIDMKKGSKSEYPNHGKHWIIKLFSLCMIIQFIFITLPFTASSNSETSILQEQFNTLGGGEIWELAEEREFIIDVSKCSDSFIKISTEPDMKERLIPKPNIDPTEFLSSTALIAVAQSPDWLEADLTSKFIDLSQRRLDLGDDANAAFGDLDGDGDQDMLCGSSEGGLEYYENKGTPYEPIFLKDKLEIDIEDINLNSIDPACGDLDNDGDMEVIIGNEIGDVIIFYNTGSNDEPNYNNRYRFVEILPGYSSPCVGDIDNDNDLDIICGANDGRIYTLLNLGPDWDYSLTLTTSPEMIDVGSRSKPTLADLDDDGDLDITIGEDQAVINYYENQGSIQNAVWRYDSTMYLGLILAPQTSPSLADLNGDQRYDLFVGGSPGQLYKFDNLGSAMEPEWEIWSTYKVFPGIAYYDPQQYVKIVDHDLLDDFAELITTAKDNHKDEIAFSIAHTSTQVLHNPDTTPELYKRNVELMYEIDQYLDYANIKDVGTIADANYYSTVTYSYKEKNSSMIQTTELPRDIYYWYVVHPKITDEIPAYINPATGESASAPLGVFWREYLFYHNDTKYPADPPTDPDENGIPNYHYPKEESPPLLKEKLSGISYVYDSQPYNAPVGYNHQGYNNSRPWGYKDHAIEAISNWVAKTLPLNEQESADGERPIQPVRIAHHHNGNCGELQDLSIAASRTALIPATGILLPAEDHVWNEFYDRGWRQWDNYWSDGGSVVDNNMNYWVGWGQRGGSGLVKWRGDDSTTDVTHNYVPEKDLSTIKVTVYGRMGNPVDGARVMLGSHWLTGQASGYQVTFPYPSVWNYTDTNGSCTFRVATQEGMPDGNQNFSFKVISKVGNAERPKTQLEHGEDIEIEFRLDGYLPEGELLYTVPVVDDPPDRFMVMAYWEVLSATQQPPNPLVGNYHPQSVSLGRDLGFYLFNESNFEYYCKSNYMSDGYVPCIPVENGNSDEEVVNAYQLLDNTNWYFVGYHKNTVETSKRVKLKLLLYEMKDELPEVRILEPTNGQTFEVGEEVTISGWAKDDRSVAKLTMNINKERIDITNTLVDENWTYLWDTSEYEAGNYTIMVFAEDTNGNGFGLNVHVTLTPPPPPDITKPKITIDTPENGSAYLLGEPVTISGSASDDHELGLTALSFTIDSKTIDLLESIQDDKWSYTWDTTDKDTGNYKFNLRAVDGSENIGRAFGHFELIEEPKDYESPELTMDSPKLAESFSLGTRVVIKGTATDNVGVTSLEINIDYLGWMDITDSIIGNSYTYTWDTALTQAEVGEHIISVQASDKAENTEEVTNIISLTDITPPSITIDTPPSGRSFKAGETISIGGDLEDNVDVRKVELIITGEGDTIEIRKGIDILVNDWEYEWSIPTNIVAGDYTLIATATDMFGNTDSDSISITITKQKKTEKDEGMFGLPGFEGLMLVAVILLFMIMLRRRRRF
jgi:hypothetical protein